MALIAAMALVAGGLVATSASPAWAATGNMLPPFDIGTTWNICQGYDNSAPNATHKVGSTSEYGLDLTGAGCDNSAAGRNVRAPIAGTVYRYQAEYGNLCVNIAGNRSYTLTHINPTVTSGSVTAGQLVGTVAAAAPKGTPPNNNNLAHLHFQIWAAPNCYNNAVIPFDSADGTRICGAPDLTPTGPNRGNGIWSGTPFTAASCDSTNTTDTDADGVVDSSDWCIYDKGTVPNRGCPNSIHQLSGDFNGDGKGDIIAVSRGPNNEPGLSWFRSTSDATTTAVADPAAFTVSLPAPAWNVDGLKWAAGDFNGDGKSDLLVVSGTPTSGPALYILLSDGMQFGPPQPVASPNPAYWQWGLLDWYAGDFDGDGKADVIYVSRGPDGSPGLGWFKSTSTGTTASLASPAGFSVVLAAPAWNTYGLKWGVGDFNGDGKADVFVASGTTGSGPGMYILTSNGSQLSNPVNVASPNPAYWLWDRLTFTIGDVDGDHRADVIYVSRGPDDSPGLGWFPSTSTTTSTSLGSPIAFTVALPAPAWNVSGLKWAIIDANGDGRADVLSVSGWGYGGVGIYLLTSNGSQLNNPVNVASPNPAYWQWARLQF